MLAVIIKDEVNLKKHRWCLLSISVQQRKLLHNGFIRSRICWPKADILTSAEYITISVGIQFLYLDTYSANDLHCHAEY